LSVHCNLQILHFVVFFFFYISFFWKKEGTRKKKNAKCLVYIASFFHVKRLNTKRETKKFCVFLFLLCVQLKHI
jgi:hypothetical protein